MIYMYSVKLCRESLLKSFFSQKYYSLSNLRSYFLTSLIITLQSILLAITGFQTKIAYCK